MFLLKTLMTFDTVLLCLFIFYSERRLSEENKKKGGKGAIFVLFLNDVFTFSFNNFFDAVFLCFFYFSIVKNAAPRNTTRNGKKSAILVLFLKRRLCGMLLRCGILFVNLFIVAKAVALRKTKRKGGKKRNIRFVFK